MKSKTITVFVIVDVVGALADDELDKNIYLLDNNKSNGSKNEGTGTLKTKVSKGDTIIWSIYSIEPEAYAAISDIVIDEKFCTAEQKNYEGTDVNYWLGKVKEDIEILSYKIKLDLGNRKGSFITEKLPSLIGNSL